MHFKDFVLQPFAGEHHESIEKGLDINMGPGIVNAQASTILRVPTVVQVVNRGGAAVLSSRKAIDVPNIPGVWKVFRKLDIEPAKAQERLQVQFALQPLK